VAATKTPIIFLGVGEHLQDLDRFSPGPFISQLLGMGDMQGLMEHMTDMARQNPTRQKEMTKAFEEGKLSIRDWREQMQNIMSMSVFQAFRSYLMLIPFYIGVRYQKLPLRFLVWPVLWKVSQARAQMMKPRQGLND
jgi:signal recognition particle subunit SRP54